MHHRAKTFATPLAFLALTASAWAADPIVFEPPPAPPPVAVSTYDWSGPYIGIQGGYGWAELEEAEGTDLFEFGDSVDVDGGFLGIHAGYNFQWDRLVLGVEGDINKAWMDEDFIWGGDEIGSVEIDWFGSLRARLGFAADRTLFFATAGVATADLQMDLPVGPGSDSETFTGWTAGLGVEHAFRENWLARAEYRYYDFGDGTFFSGADAEDLDLTMHAISIGLSYKF